MEVNFNCVVFDKNEQIKVKIQVYKQMDWCNVTFSSNFNQDGENVVFRKDYFKSFVEAMMFINEVVKSGDIFYGFPKKIKLIKLIDELSISDIKIHYDHD